MNDYEALRFRLVINPGFFLGLGGGIGTVVIVFLTVIAAIYFFNSFLRMMTSAVGAAGLGLIFGAIVGQTSDRLFRDVGGVVDFIEIHWLLPVINVADLGVIAGYVLLMRSRRRHHDLGGTRARHDAHGDPKGSCA